MKNENNKEIVIVIQVAKKVFRLTRMKIASRTDKENRHK